MASCAETLGLSGAACWARHFFPLLCWNALGLKGVGLKPGLLLGLQWPPLCGWSE